MNRPPKYVNPLDVLNRPPAFLNRPPASLTTPATPHGPSSSQAPRSPAFCPNRPNTPPLGWGAYHDNMHPDPTLNNSAPGSPGCHSGSPLLSPRIPNLLFQTAARSPSPPSHAYGPVSPNCFGPSRPGTPTGANQTQSRQYLQQTHTCMGGFAFPVPPSGHVPQATAPGNANSRFAENLQAALHHALHGHGPGSSGVPSDSGALNAPSTSRMVPSQATAGAQAHPLSNQTANLPHNQLLEVLNSKTKDASQKIQDLKNLNAAHVLESALYHYPTHFGRAVQRCLTCTDTEHPEAITILENSLLTMMASLNRTQERVVGRNGQQEGVDNYVENNNGLTSTIQRQTCSLLYKTLTGKDFKEVDQPLKLGVADTSQLQKRYSLEIKCLAWYVASCSYLLLTVTVGIPRDQASKRPGVRTLDTIKIEEQRRRKVAIRTLSSTSLSLKAKSGPSSIQGAGASCLRHCIQNQGNVQAGKSLSCRIVCLISQ